MPAKKEKSTKTKAAPKKTPKQPPKKAPKKTPKQKYSIFDDILAQAMRSGKVPQLAKNSIEWYKRITQKTGSSTRSEDLMRESQRLKARFQVGRMYHFHYDPKWKKELPYYDTFPLVFPIGPARGGFLGINLHYLPLNYRATLMGNLYGIMNNKKFDQTTKLVLSYSLLNSASKYKYFRPCIKHYLSRHVKSKFLRIESVEWNIALFLPTEQFQKRTKNTVWKHSRKLI